MCTSLSAAPLCRPPLLPRMPGFPLGLLRAGPTHPLALVLAGLGLADGGAGQSPVAVAASQVPLPFSGSSQQTGLPLHRDPQTPFTVQVPGTAQTVLAVSGPHAGRHLWS